MVTLVLPQDLLDRARRQSAAQPWPAPRLADRSAATDQPMPIEPATPHGFETEAAATGEDCLRARRIRRVLNRPGPTTWLNIRDRLWLHRQASRTAWPSIDREAAQDLAARLEGGVASGRPPVTLASSMRMRTIRQGLNRALLDAFAEHPNEDLRTVTVIYNGWSYDPRELDRVTATAVKKQFRRHLERAGVLRLPGPLFAVLHGEFEPTSGRYILHFHLVTTTAKAAALKAGLTAQKIRGYTKTATGSPPVRRSRLRNRIVQFSYLAKSYWPSRPVIRIDGKPKRLRDHHRIPEPFGTQILLWHDRQKFPGLVLTHDCWSRRNGGTEAMKRLCLFVAEVG